MNRTQTLGFVKGSALINGFAAGIERFGNIISQTRAIGQIGIAERNTHRTVFGKMECRATLHRPASHYQKLNHLRFMRNRRPGMETFDVFAQEGNTVFGSAIQTRFGGGYGSFQKSRSSLRHQAFAIAKSNAEGFC
ncbi:hypothetical protein [Neisseria iguanae]|uniref:hypothetical protein n=1 Tax=Neisseria iguanae TaxID=90242 RepID=UPI0011B1E67B|nr:hypothetical protein [Neisseria iguanae]